MFEVIKSTNGNTHLAGEDFDVVPFDYLLAELKQESSIDLSANRMAIQRICEAAETAKIELSALQTEINLPFITADASGPRHINSKVLRSQFETLVQCTVDPCRKALSDAGIKASEIDKVILVGTMTCIPRVSETVKSIFGREPSKGIDAEEAVAIGASIQHGVLVGNVTDILLLDVTPLSRGTYLAICAVGLELTGGDEQTLKHLCDPSVRPHHVSSLHRHVLYAYNPTLAFVRGLHAIHL